MVGRHRGFTLVEVMVVVLILSVLATIGAMGWRNAQERAKTTACVENRWQIERAKQVWAMENSKRPDDEATLDDVHPSQLKTLPTCPRGGNYTIGSLNEPSRCTACP